MKSFEDKFASVADNVSVENDSELSAANFAVSHNKIVLIEIENIAVGTRLRSISKSKVDELAESIATVGLLQPIVITEDKHLVAGLHRLEACRQLGLLEINAVVIPNHQLQKEIAEIDENLIRNQLTVLEQCDQLKRRKELYEALYPETKRGGYVRAGNEDFQSEDINDNRVVKDAFSNRAAFERKVTPRTIQRAIRIAERLHADIKNQISDLPIALRFTQLMQLAELQPAMQREVVARMCDEKLSYSQAVKFCRENSTANNQGNAAESIVKTKRKVKKWIASFSSLLKQFEEFTLTELQSVIEQIKRDCTDFSALRHLSVECGETLNFEKSENKVLMPPVSSAASKNTWCKNAPIDTSLPLFHEAEMQGEPEK